MDSRLTLNLVSHTHWDREWYRTFQQFRMKLVEVIDEVLDILDTDPDFRYFMLDGQTVVLEDYLEIKPQQQERLAKYIRQGRLQVGPWYVSPDFFLTSGESTVRNLMLGHRLSQEFGATMKVGYLPDVFGHISQMPQILQGFGIDSAVIYRGVGPEATKTEFLWEASDSSKVLVIYLPDGYCHAANLPSTPEKAVEKVRALMEHLPPMATTRNLLLLNGCDHLMPQRDLPQILKAVNQNLPEAELIHATLAQHIAAVKVENPSLFTLKGEFRENRPARITPGVLSTRIYLKQANHRATITLEKFAEPLCAIAYCLGLTVQPSNEKGCHSERSEESLLTSVPQEISLPAGQDRNDKTPAPLHLRETYPAELLWQAWRYLLQCHPHDSVCGCSIDDVHHDMMRRFAWSQEISQAMTAQALDAIARQVDTRSVGEGIPILVFNSMSLERTELAQVSLTLVPTEEQILTVTAQPSNRNACHSDRRFTLSEAEGEESLSAHNLRKISRSARNDNAPEQFSPTLVDALTGTPVPFQLLKREKTYVNFDPHQGRVVGIGGELISQGDLSRELLARLKEEGKAQRIEAERWEILFLASQLPALGYRTYVFKPSRSEISQNLKVGTNFIENEFFKIKIAPNGTLIVDHKETGESYTGLHYFEDRGDAGDEYNFSPPPADVMLTTLNEKPQVTLEEQGPARATLKIEYAWRIPKSLSDDRQARSQEYVDYSITSWVSLCPYMPRIDIRTEVENLARDHRVRVGFATDIKASHSFAEMPFDVVQRKVEFSEENALPEKRVPLKGGEEVKVGTYPQRTFVSISDGNRGLTIINQGLPEYEVFPGEKGAIIFLTLLRCIGWLSRGDLLARKGNAGPSISTPDAQCLGRHVFHYALMPHRGDWEAAKSYLEAYGFNSPPVVQEMDCLPVRCTQTGQQGFLPLSNSFVSIQPPELVLSAFKKAERGEEVVLRFYNITSREVQGCLRFFLPIEQATVVNLNEEPLDDAPLKIGANNEILLTVPGRKVVTIQCKLKRPC